MSNETSTLLAQPVTIAGYAVKPWTLKKFAEVYPAVRALVQKLVAQGLTLDNLDTFIIDQGLDLLPHLVDEVPPLLAATLDISQGEAEELPVATAALLLGAICTQNLEPLKNFWSLVPRKKGTGLSTLSP